MKVLNWHLLIRDIQQILTKISAKISESVFFKNATVVKLTTSLSF